MSRIDTGARPAEMIYLEPGRNGAAMLFVGYPVHVHDAVPLPHLPVAPLVSGTDPNPAARHRFRHDLVRIHDHVMSLRRSCSHRLHQADGRPSGPMIVASPQCRHFVATTRSGSAPAST